MTIKIGEDQLIFHLQTDNTSYIFQVLENGELGQVYYGKKIHVKDSYDRLTTKEWHNDTPSWKSDVPNVQPELLKQEYAGFGKGDFRYPAYQIEAKDGSRVSEFAFDSYQLTDGKKRLTGLPSMFDDSNDDAETLTIVLKDSLLHLKLNLAYTIFPHQDVIVRSSKFVNDGNQDLMLNRALSLQLDLPDSMYDLIQFSGTWARERHLYRNRIHSGVQSISSLRTASSHQQNPFFMLARPTTTDQDGDVFGINLIYSGNFLDQVEVDQFETTRVLTGINPEEFSWTLEPGTEFQTPEAVISYTDKGMNQLSQQMGNCYLNHLVNPNFARENRPILINNWEGTYFDFDDNKLFEIAKNAHELGVEMFVLDDGWFGHRNDDKSSLGDWFVNEAKFPGGFSNMVNKIHALGMKFGLWFEPEMISIDSKLYTKHPDWLICAPNRQRTPQRTQFVLDMSRPEVVDFLYDSVSEMIKQNKLDYIKWDMNRNITEAFGGKLSADRQKELSHRYILGVYNLYERLTADFPNVLFESCASGGGRFDLGLMYYAPQAWTSDNTDAVERMFIQYGTSYGYSLSMMGAHVSAVPNDQTGRITPLKTRADVAYFGNLGYELDVTQMPDHEQRSVKRQIEFYKQNRELFQFGRFYRLVSPYDTNNNSNVISWEVVKDDQSQAIVAYYQVLNRPNPPYSRLYFEGLDPERKYKVNDGDEEFYGDELMNAGYFVPQVLQKIEGVEESADFSSQLFIVRAVN
ncbi:alpha-galactosidase [Sporolactobacillus shoreicorticis]|uniref:Alpha-galactosidase n=1 Tax=Sporolactobacillus shoreicorticis TaxID=1923877 RepID=A0ABW5S1R2_9BACL|nr:alpha-galactosidase [Sporolactobacillus shoreicorticis]MCO7127859.1 alpha-galactosidase [Sporolactobacillus shoreicorticis]